MRSLAILSLLCWLVCFQATDIFTVGVARAKTLDGERQMIVASAPLAAEAGRDILRAGGTATDAAIAALLVLGLVEPQSAGIGGSAFLLHYSAKSKRVDAYDGRDAAPAAAAGRMFLGPDGESLALSAAAIGGRAVGVPGLLRLAKLTHLDHGRLPWSALFAPAISLAEQGFPVSQTLHRTIEAYSFLRDRPATATYFYRRDGRPIARGDRLRNPAYAATLQQVSVAGPSAFYSGAVAQRIVSAVRKDAENPGFMALRDLDNYRAKRRLALCIPYRVWRICGAPPPASGGLEVLQAMAILAHFDMSSLAEEESAAQHLIAEASRLAAADRAAFLADPDFVEVPVQQLMDPTYLQGRAALISPDRSLETPSAGIASDSLAAMPPQATESATTHLSVVDQWGNAVSVTASLGSAFGSHLMVDGFLLNNDLIDFSFVPSIAGQPVANQVQGGKRPIASMAPTMVLDDRGNLVLTIGSAAGSHSAESVVQALVAALDWGLDLDDALALPHGTSAATRNAINAIRPVGQHLSGATAPRGDGVLLAD